MNDLAGRRSRLLVDVLQGSGGTAERPPARLRIRAAVLVTTLAMVATTAFAALPALARVMQPKHASTAMPVHTVADVQTVATPTPAPAPTPTTAPPPPVAMAASALPPLTFANQFLAEPNVAGQWSAASGGAPGFAGPDRWSTAAAAASAQWTLGSPGGGRRWDDVRVRAWIPNDHAVAWVRYTVTSTNGGAAAVRTFDVSQRALNGWYTLPAAFRIGTPAQRTGTIAVRMTYLRPDTTMATGGCEMAAAQVRFEWS
jgi:hypothetical protein